MKFRFYVDLPPRAWSDMHLEARTNIRWWALQDNYRRVAFDVDLPIEMQDEMAAEPGKVVEDQSGEA
jgi:hypothetical protein